MSLKALSSKTIYDGPIFDVRRDTIREGDAEYERDVIVHPGSAVVVPLFADGTVALVRQYRHPAGKYMLEVPAGSLDSHDEPPETGAARELEEEIGYKAGKLEKLAEFYVSPGFLTEKMHVYVATDLTETQQNLDHDEFVEVVRIPLEKAIEMARNGKIEDAKTIIGLTFCQNR